VKLLRCVSCSSEWWVLLIVVGGRLERWGSGSQVQPAAAPTIHRHSLWTVLMLAPWSVVSWYPGSVPPDSTLCRCGRIFWSGRIYSKSCDAPPLIGNAQDCFGVAVGCMQKWAHGSQCFLSHPLDQTDTTTVNPLHPKCACGSGNRRDSDRGRVLGRPHQQGRPHLLIRPHQQGRPHLLIRPHLPGVARWFPFYS
jgi:hypothetical protein